ncbi:peptidylprolyl isomerase [Effusibacillus lacus]|uniref:Peptidyl-prolyl cis-trans isomerase n=1 Tax=Effusibacillus lacus TaxID=1348429 RepID=A0A292YMS4_9BACL|nr:peptidylprolyl isomerase [Effusibacillus lacus]TCS72338.1 cyclophilin family peptidyl-prolyl cis-trans isomerase [Effusibacillus lacus]GAX90199.1 peptidyl-prolyl cis-trans isomerase [Effusibacillus lacus]
MKRKIALLTLSAMLAAGLATGCGTAEPGKPAPAQGNQGQQGQAPANQSPTASKHNKYKEPPQMVIDPAKSYFATLHTSKGDIKIQLYAKDAPVTVNNFVFLARDKFYDGIKFHRIIKGFMIQTGDPLGNGTGGPGYKFKDELPPKYPYEPGVVAMANSGPNTNGSQFFIGNGDEVKVLQQMPNYTVFGKVIEGMDVVQKISSVPTRLGPDGAMSVPKEEVIIKSVTIEEK